MDAPSCTCPPMRDVFREGVGTRDPCPVHPDPEWLAEAMGKLKERVDTRNLTIDTVTRYG